MLVCDEYMADEERPSFAASGPSGLGLCRRLLQEGLCLAEEYCRVVVLEARRTL